MTTEARAAAERIAKAMCGDDHLACTYPDCGCKVVPARVPAVLAIVEAAHAAGRREGLEEAAKIAEDHRGFDDCCLRAGEDIAASIRALPDAPKPGGKADAKERPGWERTDIGWDGK